jgi:hypothetical protein
MMNRRTFLTTAGAASLAPFVLTSRKSSAQASLIDPSLLANCAYASAVAFGNLWQKQSTPADWDSIVYQYDSLRTAVLASGSEPAFCGQFPDYVDPGAFDPAPATQTMQNWYDPSFQASDLMYYYNRLPQDPTSITQACQGWQASGLSGACSSVITAATIMSQAAGGGSGGLLFGRTLPREGLTLREDFGFGSYGCGHDGAAVLFTGIAFGVLAIMAGPAGVLAMAFWEGLALWGGIGAGVWGAGHSLFCPF